MRFGIRLLIVLAFTLLLSSPKLVRNGLADNGPTHRVQNSHFGVSGGNVNDITKRFCCSGTLGALVKDTTGAFYILSNNHVLGLSGQANPGDDISQPGLIENGCRPQPIVADFTTAPQLGPSNVDAAIAQLKLNIPNQMDTSGFIEDIGVICSVVRAPEVNLSVAKSGRTTGFTTGTIASIDTDVSVQYQASCGQGKKFLVSYTNQVVINSSTFSAGGDSGSLIVTNNSSHQPVALLFAGSSTSTIANPIDDVLSQLTAKLGSTVSFVGSSCATPSGAVANSSAPTQEIGRAIEAKKRHGRGLMSRPGVIGVGVGDAADNSREGAVIVFVDKTTGFTPELPGRVDSVKVRVVLSDPFVAY
jgi:hypothetical protein